MTKAKRIRRMGWGGSLLLMASSAFGTSGHFGLSPDNSQELLLQTISSAQQDLKINIYEFKSAKVAAAVVDRIKAGVNVKVLVEGQPVGGALTVELDNLKAIRAAMTQQKNLNNAIWVMTNGKLSLREDLLEDGGDGIDRSNRRFVYNHAKYIVADFCTVLVGSENYSPNGHADPGNRGNRGWESCVVDCTLGNQMQKMFESDRDVAFGDVIKVASNKAIPLTMAKTPDEEDDVGNPKVRTVKPFGIAAGAVNKVTLVTSPKSGDDLIRLMDEAQTSVGIQHMDLPYQWWDPIKKQYYVSDLVDGLVRAARRGVAVRVILNDPYAWGKPKPAPPGQTLPVPANLKTVKYLNDLAHAEKLDLEARVIDLDGAEVTYIHNKGMVVDGYRALVSSINGSRNSVQNNREVALVVEGKTPGQYYQKAFNWDWARSGASFVRAFQKLSFGLIEPTSVTASAD